ncbi:hypothetical protein [Bacillus cereus]|uniref:hypothetical protein n=1 Tax=Bacillus cereus TaxID=1396 RepID=UPI001F277771|nr:hypothetical protein [Bacillus cereus]BCB35596.1 hypothetical protein BCM0045_0491 [Bacillus cereus]BCB98405.1 hypothetical protein BCM0057_0488 [Bacillus cereus]BCC21898.1 hypothetical protein BCM0079_0491 [Bacillus cereus]BCC33509.1 hypothetical protein BCM0105_0499 [Bacillus cereus]
MKGTESVNLISIIQLIDKEIKELWLTEIYYDYCSFSLLKEDSLKNSFYHHLRNRLTDEFLLKNSIRIFTEFSINGIRADLAIVKLSDTPGENDYLQNSVEDILAIVEMKYKNHWNDTPFIKDIKKIKNCIKTFPYKNCQYYLAFIQEAVYEQNDFAWLTLKDIKWANGHVTELNGYYIENNEQPVWKINSYNNLNN